MKLVRVVAPHFVAGFETDGVIRRAAPIIKHMQGWDDSRARRYIGAKGWKASIIATAAFTASASAATLPHGYVPAIIIGRAPEGSHAMEGYAKRKDCGRSIAVLVDRDGRLLPASGQIVCR